jgi:hypothetical protein
MSTLATREMFHPLLKRMFGFAVTVKAELWLARPSGGHYSTMVHVPRGYGELKSGG